MNAHPGALLPELPRTEPAALAALPVGTDCNGCFAAALMRDSSDAIVAVCQAGLLQYANPSAQHLLEIDELELAGKPITHWLSFVEAGPGDGWTQLLQRRREGASLDATVRQADGTDLHLSVSVSPGGGENSSAAGTLLTLRPLAEPRATALALAQREARFRALSEASPVGVFAADTQGNCTYTNSRWQDIFGLDADQSLGDAWLRSLHPMDMSPVCDEWQRCCEDRAEFDLEFRVRDRAGLLTQVRCRARPIVMTGDIVTGFVGSVEDVSERHILMQRVRASELRERRLHEQTPSMLHSTDRRGQLLTVSERWLRKLGWERHEVIGRPVDGFFTPGSAALLRGEIETELTRQGHCARKLLQMQARDGTVIDVEGEAMLERDANQRPLRTIAVFEDVTERLRAEQALQSERQRLAYIIKATQVGTWEWNVATGEVRFNARWAAIIGCTLDELQPTTIKTCAERMHPEDLAASNAALQRHFDGEADAYVCEARMRHRDGHWVWVLDRGRVMTWAADGSPEWMFGTHQDITQRKAQEESLLRSRALLDRTGRLAKVGGWEVNLAENTLLWSPVTCQIHGVPESFKPDLANAINFYAPEARAQVVEAVRRACEFGESWEFELPLIRADGERIWVQVVGSPEHEDGQVVRLVGAFQDVTERRAQRIALERSNERSELATSAGGVGVWEYDCASGNLLWDAQMHVLYGTLYRDGPLNYSHWAACIHPDDRARADGEVAVALQTMQRFESEFRVIWPDGSVRHLRSAAQAVANAQGQPERMTGMNWDVTEARLLQGQLAEQRELLEVTLSAIVDAVITTDMDGRVRWLNRAAEQLTGVTLAEAAGQALPNVVNLIDALSREAVASPLASCLLTGKRDQHEQQVLLVRRDGREFGVEATASPMRSVGEVQMGAALMLHDVTEHRRLVGEMSYRATHDELTGLCNRAEFSLRLGQVLRQAQEAGNEHALLYIDLDQFKLVNDTCGHAVGDRMLQQVSRELMGCMRARDTLARLGGDEFGALLEHCTVEQSQRVAQQICERLDEFRFTHDGRRLRIGASVGLVPIDRRWTSEQAILQAADNACYAAKEAGRNRVHVWFESDHTLQSRHGDMQWATRVEQALDNDQFVLFHQRIVPIHGVSTGLRAEVLVRLRQPDGSLAPPGAFLPATERFHLASRLDRWVLRHTIEWLMAVEDLSLIDALSVNLSGQSIGDRAFHKEVTARLSTVPSAVLERLCLEVTETAAVTNLADAADFITAMRALGIRVALDDFGAGASSFGYLKSLPVDYLKIDGQFIRDLLEDPLDAAAVRCFVEVAQVVGVKTVAEFVDNPAVLEALRHMQVDYAQGYLLHKPSPLDTALNVTT